MSPDDLREKIARDQGWTICFCSARAGAVPRPFELCSDCVGWLRDHSPRIAYAWVAWWRLWHEYAEIATPKAHLDQATADAAEAEDRAWYGL